MSIHLIITTSWKRPQHGIHCRYIIYVIKVYIPSVHKTQYFRNKNERKHRTKCVYLPGQHNVNINSG